jgi:PIN domain nuclease of toxin-antitoxin system
LRLLLDTHALLWALEGNPKLSRKASAAMADAANEILVSAASIMEITTKHRLGKLPQAALIAADWNHAMKELRATSLPLSIRHAAEAGGLPIPHRDPFDRMLIAQAQIEDAWLVSIEKLFDDFAVRRLW